MPAIVVGHISLYILSLEKNILMMQTKTIIMAALLMILLQGCVKNEFKIVFDLPDTVNANYRLLYYASDKRTGWEMETVAPVSAGKGTANCITRMPTLIYLFSLGSNRPSIVIYAERGDKITITGKDQNPLEWNISGNSINKKLSDWRRDNIKALMSEDASAINKAVALYVRKNPGSEVSTILLLTSYDRRIDERGYDELWKLLKKGALDESLIRLIGRTDQLSGIAKGEEKVRAMKFHCMNDTVINFDPKSYPATIFYFWRNGSVGKEEVFKTLDSIANDEKPDRDGMVVKVCFDPDSIVWHVGQKTDSLTKGINAWVFAGEADESIINLNVPRTPYFIVSDRGGRQIYRGSDSSLAIREYRKLLNRKKK